MENCVNEKIIANTLKPRRSGIALRQEAQAGQDGHAQTKETVTEEPS
jgi:hypothetical protein